MDPFTHFLLGYLITFAVWGPGQLQYVIAGALAGGLPDADVIFFPLSRRFPSLRHRGMSHSILGVTVIAGAGTFLVPPLLGWVFGDGYGAGSPVFFFLALEFGGLSHVLLDALDHWSIPAFAPFSKREYHLDADRIVNLGAMVFTVVSYSLLIYERGRAPVWVWAATSWVLLGAALLYISVRLVARWRAGVACRREGYSSVVPQANPLVFLLVDEKREGTGVTLRFGRYHFLRGFRYPPQALELSDPPGGAGPVRDGHDALERSYGPSLKESWVLGETLHFGEVRGLTSSYEVFWYSLEFTWFGRAAGVLASVDAVTGEIRTKSLWRAPGQPGI
jgi:membrane-bound metal-dependent hydrolase YbcI (DUF457 family)